MPPPRGARINAYIQLGADEIPAGRPFADPERTRADLAALREMAEALRRLLGTSLPGTPRPLTIDVGGSSGPQHRVILCDEGRLRAAVAPGFVGFFAERRPGLDHAPLTVADDELIGEFGDHPGILSYSSLELADGNWGNLIVVDPPEAREHWRTSERHAYAARELAPRHYAVVRLHNGHFPDGLLSGRDPVLARTRYHDFQGSTPWRAERPLATPP